MQHRTTEWIGIDVSQAHLDVALATTGASVRVSNDPEGMAHLRTWLPPTGAIVVESTGLYHRAVWFALGEAGYAVTVVNPSWTHHFAASHGRRAKTDRQDAQMLAQYGQQMCPSPTLIPSRTQQDLAQLQRCQAGLIRDRVRATLRAQTMTGFCQQTEQDLAAFLETKLLAVATEITALIATDSVLLARQALLQTVPGIGVGISQRLVARLPELGLLDRRQIASLAGLAPHPQDSGTIHGHRRTVGGRRDVAQTLYQAAVTALRWNPLMRAHYDQLRARTVPVKVALIACARRLLGLLTAMLREGLRWEELRTVQTFVPPEGGPSVR